MSELCLPISPVKIAVIQYDPQVGLDNRDGNLKHGLALARRAAREGANLIVLPELANTGYTFQSRAKPMLMPRRYRTGPASRRGRTLRRNNRFIWPQASRNAMV